MVPVDQPLLLTIELVSMSKGKESYSMSHAEKLEVGGIKKERANAVFKAGNHRWWFRSVTSVHARTVPQKTFPLFQACEADVRSCFEVVLVGIQNPFWKRICQRSQARLRLERVSLTAARSFLPFSPQLILINLIRAQCCIKTFQWKDALKLAENCLLIDRSNIKAWFCVIFRPRVNSFLSQALYRRGFARLHLGQLVEAEVHFLLQDSLPFFC
jgi:hypothetical protein